MAIDISTAIQSLVQVDGGRGFVVEKWLGGFHSGRLVITAAHCLPGWEGTMPALLGELGGEPSIAAQCIFSDPFADLAVLISVDSQAQELARDFEAYEALVDAATPLALGRATAWETPVPTSLISLDGRPITCTASHEGLELRLTEMSEPIVAGMSGSPVLDKDDAAIGIICQHGGGEGTAARLLPFLPGWLLVACGMAGAVGREALHARDYFRAQALKRAIESGLILTYLTKVPKTVPAGKVVQHNFPPREGQKLSEDGFRAWLVDRDTSKNRCVIAAGRPISASTTPPKGSHRRPNGDVV
jgi:hypothetical protein